jgi:peptide chain release factor subunit 1
LKEERMLSREELKEIAKLKNEGTYFVSLYLNVNPMTTVRDNYVIHVKNMLRQAAEKLDKPVLKKVKADIGKIESYILTNKRMFKKGLVILSSQERKFWKEYHLAVPFRNEIIVDTTPYVKPLFDVLDNYQRCAILLVDRESARFFLVHLGEIEEYTEVHSEDVPGRHKKGGWFSLAEKSYERHIDYHVGLHLKDVLKELEAILSGEYVGRMIIGGSEEAVSKVRAMLSQGIAEKVIGTFQAEMFANNKEILKKAEPLLQAYEKKKETEDIEELLTKAMKNENAVLGIENVLNALQEGRVMKLIVLQDFKQSGLSCKQCNYLSVQDISSCPFCKGDMLDAKYLVDLIAQKAVEQGAFIEVASENRKLREAGSIGAFLRF